MDNVRRLRTMEGMPKSVTGAALKALRKRAGMTVQAVADELGVPKSTYASKEDKSKRDAVPPELVRGLIPIYQKRGINAADIVSLLRLGPAEHATATRTLGAGNTTPSGIDVSQIPLLDYVGAGRWLEMRERFSEGDILGFLPSDKQVTADMFALTVEGPSMEPEFKSGDRIIVDGALKPQPGHYVIAKLHGVDEATFKKYRPRGRKGGLETFDLVPLNPDWPTITVDASNPGEIIGTVIGHRRTLV